MSGGWVCPGGRACPGGVSMSRKVGIPRGRWVCPSGRYPFYWNAFLAFF